MYFSISAPQQVTLPDGQVLSFRVNAQDSSLCEIHIVGVDGNDVAGTHVLTFKRNGAPSDTQFIPVPKPIEQPAYKTGPTDAEIEAKKQADLKVADAPYASVNKDAVRADDWKNDPKASGMYGSAPATG